MPTSAQKKYCFLSKSWFKPARKNNGVNELYLWNETYEFGTMIVWPVNDKQVKQCLKFHKYKGPKPGPMGSAKILFRYKGGPNFLFFTDVNVRAIVHEAVHLISAEMDHRNIPSTSKCGETETWAYLMEWLVDEMMKKMKPKIQ